MIRTLQKRFVISAMTAVTVLLATVLGALNIFNAVSNTRQTEALLDELAMRGAQPFFSGYPGDGGPASGMPGGQEAFGGGDFSSPLPVPETEAKNAGFAPGTSPGRRRGFLDDPMDENARLSAVYFTVDLDERCSVKAADVSHIADVTEEEAAALAQGLDVDHESGKVDAYRYKVFSVPQGGYRVVFLESGARTRAVLRVLLLSALVGGISWLLMLGLVILLSKRAIRPIAENMERQRQFVTDAGHELKTPLAIILANVDAMELRGGESKYSRNIRSQAQRLTELTRNLLTLARMDETAQEKHAETFDLSALCEESFGAFREAAELKHIRFETGIHDGIPFHGDRTQIAQLCSILGDNAVKYSPENGKIAVALVSEGKIISLTVSNTVSDVPDTKRMFDRFYRSDSARTQKSGGFGIGLSAAQGIVSLHHGSISAFYDEETSELRMQVKLPA